MNSITAQWYIMSKYQIIKCLLLPEAKLTPVLDQSKKPIIKGSIEG